MRPATFFPLLSPVALSGLILQWTISFCRKIKEWGIFIDLSVSAPQKCAIKDSNIFNLNRATPKLYEFSQMQMHIKKTVAQPGSC